MGLKNSIKNFLVLRHCYLSSKAYYFCCLRERDLHQIIWRAITYKKYLASLEQLVTILTIYLLCTVKIIFGPTMGYAAGLPPLLTVVITVAGMMTTVVLFSFLGEWIRETILKRYIKPKKVFTKRNRRFVRVWRKYGEMGISFLTPILLSPPGGSIIAMALGGSKKKIIAYMFLWSVFWTTIITYTFYYSGDALRNIISSAP